MALSSLGQLVVDPWLSAVLAALREAGVLDSTDEVEVDAGESTAVCDDGRGREWQREREGEEAGCVMWAAFL
jgi:hypothetical protein